jgi:hypothetical protein
MVVFVIGHAKDMCNLKWNVTLNNMKTVEIIKGIHLLNLLGESNFEGV